MRTVAFILVALLVAVTFLSDLGATDLWGRRESRVAAEAADTLRYQHYLVAELRDEPRLGKPPLPRWSSAVAIALTNEWSERAIRLPYAVAALVTVWICYHWGVAIGGWSCGLTAVAILSSTTLFAAQMRQATADSLLVVMVASALWLFFKAVNSELSLRRSTYLFLSGAVAGGGVLCKGLVGPTMVLIAVTGYLLCSRRPKAWRWLLRWQWWLALLVVALPWPLLVLHQYPEAWRVWVWEAQIKLIDVTGNGFWNRDLPLLLDYVPMTLPWAVFAVGGLILPFRRDLQVNRDALWLAWWWCAGNLIFFSCWKTAKHNYFMPCYPAAALLGAALFSWTVQQAHEQRAKLVHVMLALQWVLIAVALIVLAVISWWVVPDHFGLVVGASGVGLVTVAAAWHWRNCWVGIVLLSVPHLFGLLVFNNLVASQLNARSSYKQFAKSVIKACGSDQVMWYLHDADESLWFYMQSPPRRCGNADQLCGQLEEGVDGMCLALKAKEYVALNQDPRLQLTPEVDARKDDEHGMILVTAKLSGNSQPAANDLSDTSSYHYIGEQSGY